MMMTEMTNMTVERIRMMLRRDIIPVSLLTSFSIMSYTLVVVFILLEVGAGDLCLLGLIAIILKSEELMGWFCRQQVQVETGRQTQTM